jgi:hypothetical protein
LIERDGQALADLIAGDEVWRDSHSLKTLNAAAHLVRDNQPRNSRSSWPRSKRRGRGSCRQAMPSGAARSEICTTAMDGELTVCGAPGSGTTVPP